MGLFDKLFGKKNDPAHVRSDLLNATQKFYMPYTEKLLASDLPIVAEKVSSGTAASVASSILTGRHEVLHYNSHHISDGYFFYNMIEHESVHFDQIQKSPLHIKIQDSFKAERIAELEAYAQEGYMFLYDYASGTIDEKTVRRVLEKTRGAFALFLESYTNKKIGPTDNDIVSAMRPLRGGPLEKSEPDCFGKFFYNAAANRQFMELITVTPIENMSVMFSMFEKEPFENILEQIGGIKRLWTENFTLDNAKTELHRDGDDFLAALTKSQQQEFWQNICHLDKHQRAQVEGYKQRANAILANKP